jgi:hypothetical protein
MYTKSGVSLIRYEVVEGQTYENSLIILAYNADEVPDLESL